LSLLILVGTMQLLLRGCAGRVAPPPPEVEAPRPPPVPPPLRFIFPTSQAGLANTASTVVYMPTASGRVESALYGSTRTGRSGGRLLPRFHAGIDIAPLRRARDGKPLDDIRAVADGKVAYLQKAGGGSSYGRYVVLYHQDSLGTFYSLYAHLEAIAPALRVGTAVQVGDVIGRMGHSAATPIPPDRAHLHFEIGVFMHERFGDWLKASGYPRTHGAYHGWNLHCINPLRVLLERDRDGVRSMLEVLRTEPVAFTLLVDLARRPDYYRRYPALWEVGVEPPVRVRIDVAEGGAPLRVRAATPEDLAGSVPRVLAASPEVLGRNGCRLVSQRRGEWILTDDGQKWLKQLRF
jgi:murein DD-endopeptidase MepM/ murein hydrolase activator NlpD